VLRVRSTVLVFGLTRGAAAKSAFARGSELTTHAGHIELELHEAAAGQRGVRQDLHPNDVCALTHGNRHWVSEVISSLVSERRDTRLIAMLHETASNQRA
jgi:hypothetical protein